MDKPDNQTPEFEGELLFPANSYAEAIETYNKMKSIGEPKENYSKAFKWAESGDYKSAITYFSRAIDINPEYIDAFFARAHCYSELGEHTKAIADYSKVIKHNPKFTRALFNRGYVHQCLHDWEHALNDFNDAILLNPRDFGPYINRGVTYEKMGEVERP